MGGFPSELAKAHKEHQLLNAEPYTLSPVPCWYLWRKELASYLRSLPRVSTFLRRLCGVSPIFYGEEEFSLRDGQGTMGASPFSCRRLLSPVPCFVTIGFRKLLFSSAR